MPDAVLRRLRNCDDETTENFEVKGHPTLRRCPWSQIEDVDVLAVDRWRRWKTLGVWPFPGTAADQPAPVVDEIEACEAAFVEAMAEEQPKPPAEPKKKPKR